MTRHVIRGLGVGALLVACGGAGPPAAAPAPAVIRPGIEVLLADSMHLVRGRRVGLVTNHTGIDRAGVSDVERLLGAGVRLVALYSPEHGFRGAADPGELVASGTDSATGLPIYSLYGRTRTPTPAMLAGVDVLVVDLMDVGARYFTYISTTIEVMRAAGPAGIPVVVLDRPNPLGGTVQGNVLDRTFQTFVGPLPIPMRHGLTMGELARVAKRDLGLSASLAVVPASGWRRSLAFDATGLPWLAPSPNLPTLEALFHYPGLCLFEGTNLSVGRGTAHPFEVLGAPWLDAQKVLEIAGDMEGLKLQIVNDLAVTRPGDQKYADSSISAIRLLVTDRRRYDPTVAAVHLLAAVRRAHPAEFRWNVSHFDRLAGTDRLRAALESGESPASIVAGWSAARAT
ncbi:MAG TPA: DUF1343 domain-containing protein, partial [Gemmatimonadales bacterium]|nr:DUF1343 domain-containing protein [Gemmatimonadales bacterium]